METTDKDKKLPRRSPRERTTKPSEALLAAKRKMKQRSAKEKSDDVVVDDYAVAQSAKTLVRGKTGIVFDDLMEQHFCLWDKNYPECPERYTSVMDRIKSLGLLEKCVKLKSREGTPDEILKKHTPETIEILKRTAGIKDESELEELSSKYDAVFINNISYKTALLSVGCAIDLVDAVIKGDIQNGMAVIRPPGHHAMEGEYCGYCFYNNVALAASHALDAGVKKILIVDWDVHHGQGTQQMFYDDPRVLYFSIHRYENGSFWPNLRQSDYDYIGEKAGTGYNFNVPLNSVGMKDADYLTIFQKILLPVAYEFDPNLVIVSAGFDSALGDEKGEMEVSPACYAHLTSSLMGLAAGKVAVVLEGGYCLKSLADGAALTLRALLGFPAPQLIDYGTPSVSIVNTILDVIHAHRPYWRSLQLEETGSVGSEDVHVPVIKYLGDETKPEKYLTRNCYPVQSTDFLRAVDDRLNRLRTLTKLVDGPRVGLVTNGRMERHRNVAESDHPEKPERLRAIVSKHSEYGVMDRCVSVESRLATEEELLLLHRSEYLAQLKATREMDQPQLDAKAEEYDSVYLCPTSYECALMSAGSVIQMVDKVLSGEVTSGVAIVRPPGHHAEEDTAFGFCLFNNVALAAKHALENHGLERILLLDWDVHHGNGIQRMFEDDPRVLYISLHRYNHARFFPSSTDADYDKIGVGKGTGFNINIPWNKTGGGMTDGDYIAAFHAVVLPVAYEYKPQLVLISAGFDACVNDPLGHCKVTPEAYSHMTHWLMPLAGGRLVLTLEGGYNVTSISYAMTLCTKALLGDPLPPLSSAPTTPSPSAVETIRNVLRVQQPFWSSLAFCQKLPALNSLPQEGAKDNRGGDTARITSLMEKMKMDGSTDNGTPGPSKDAPQTLQVFLEENLKMSSGDASAFAPVAIFPLEYCPHLDQVAPVPVGGINHRAACHKCQDASENWICLQCYQVACGRHVNEHMMDHAEMLAHPLTLSLSDLSVWCYACEAYLDNKVLYPAKNALHQSKFGTELVWTHGEQPHNASSLQRR